MKSAEKTRKSLLVVLAIAIITLFVPFIVIGVGAMMTGAVSSLPGISALAGVLPAFSSSYTIGLNGVQYALFGGLTFSFLGDFMSVIPFRYLILTALACIVLIAPSILNLICLFLTIFKKTRNATISVIVLQTVSFVFHILIMIAVIRGVSQVNNVAYLRFGLGAALAPAANLAAVVLASIWYVRVSKAGPEKVSSNERNGALACLAGEYAGTTIPLRRGEELMIGRDGAFCNIVLTGDKISRKHCAVRYNPDTERYTVTDLSSNGTYVKGGVRLIKGQATELTAGTTLILGNEDNLFRLQ